MKVIDIFLEPFGYEYVGMTTGGWEAAAAWVQAIGTIVALGIAIAIPYFEHRKQEKAKKSLINNKMKVIKGIFYSADESFNQAWSVVDNIFSETPKDFEAKEKETIQRSKAILNRFQQLDINDFPGRVKVNILVDVEYYLANIEKNIEDAKRLMQFIVDTNGDEVLWSEKATIYGELTKGKASTAIITNDLAEFIESLV